jgi:hypothetical protein
MTDPVRILLVKAGDEKILTFTSFQLDIGFVPPRVQQTV